MAILYVIPAAPSQWPLWWDFSKCLVCLDSWTGHLLYAVPSEIELEAGPLVGLFKMPSLSGQLDRPFTLRHSGSTGSVAPLVGLFKIPGLSGQLDRPYTLRCSIRDRARGRPFGGTFQNTWSVWTAGQTIYSTSFRQHRASSPSGGTFQNA
jgi:hypothetical protein